MVPFIRLAWLLFYTQWVFFLSVDRQTFKALFLALGLHGLLFGLINAPWSFQNKKPTNEKHTVFLKYTEEPARQVQNSLTNIRKTVRAPSKPSMPTHKNTPLVTKSVPQSAAPIDNLLPKKRPEPLLLNQNAQKIAYPEKARILGVEGLVVLGLEISIEGFVASATVLEDPGYGLAEAALAFVRRFIFLPKTDELGHPLPSSMEYRVRFVLPY